MALDILTIGDSCIDEYLRVEDGAAIEEGAEICFLHGTKVPVEEFSTSIAGNAVNVAVGTNLLGLKTAVYSEIGDDANAERITKELKKAGVNTSYIIKNKGTLTDVHPIVVYKKDRTIFIYHEKREHKVQPWPNPRWLYYSSIGKDFEQFQQELVKYVKGNPSVGVAFNPGTYHIRAGLESIKNFLAVSHILFLNKEESIGLVGNGTLEELHKKLQELGPKLTVITDGSRGASAYDGDKLIQIPTFLEDKVVVDKTGAGDAFSSGFLAAIHYEKPLKQALIWGSINSSGVVREVGAIHGLRTKKEIEELVKNTKNI
ncbi:MAG: hypothetical protein ACD_22C00259G0010 [uncultured bacterium]|nr:MAG: hypothetical protein ACD_22C00259G0010 [uncultured bacterium]